MRIEIHDNLNADEYNKLRIEAGWDIKNPLIVEKAIRNSTIIKKATFDNKVVGMARAIGDGRSKTRNRKKTCKFNNRGCKKRNHAWRI